MADWHSQECWLYSFGYLAGERSRSISFKYDSNLSDSWMVERTASSGPMEQEMSLLSYCINIYSNRRYRYIYSSYTADRNTNRDSNNLMQSYFYIIKYTKEYLTEYLGTNLALMIFHINAKQTILKQKQG